MIVLSDGLYILYIVRSILRKIRRARANFSTYKCARYAYYYEQSPDGFVAGFQLDKSITLGIDFVIK